MEIEVTRYSISWDLSLFSCRYSKGHILHLWANKKWFIREIGQYGAGRLSNFLENGR
jgi:hypothetical protein